MALGSFSTGALADLTVDDLDRMFTLDETLFVEHKLGISSDHNSVHGLVSNIAAFANTLGGWLVIGVHKGRPDTEAKWTQAATPTLVDAVRDRLRSELDPMPAFEARVIDHPDGPVGVVRVYESSDTPHIAMRKGAVFVREVAGVDDAADPKQSGAGLHAERVFRATQVRSRAQLLELAARGQRASDRVDALMDPMRPLPLISNQLGLQFERAAGQQLRPRTGNQGRVFVRLAPYTLPASFRDWATTSLSAAAVLDAAEQASGMRGLSNNWASPHPAGVSLAIGETPAISHADSAGAKLPAGVRVVADGAGVVAVSVELQAPDEGLRRSRVGMHDIAADYVLPALQASAGLLRAGHLLGRVRCQIDLVGLPAALLFEGQGNTEADPWVPSTSDVALPASDDELLTVALRSVYAYARSAGVPAWDPPTGL